MKIETGMNSGLASWRTVLIAAAVLLLAGCYNVNSIVDAPDANPGDGVCARALTSAELSRGLRAPRLSAVEADLQQQAAALPSATLERLARGDLTAAQSTDLAPARAAAAFALRHQRTTPPTNARPGGFDSVATNLCTLRAAVMEANAHAWKSFITIPPGTYKLTLPHAPGGAGGSLLITRSMRLQGSGAAATIVDGDDKTTVVHVNPAGNADVELNHLTILNGYAQAGGGLYLQRGKVEMEDMIIRDNGAFTGGAGMVVGEFATAYLRRSTMSNNIATGLAGGAIWNVGTLWVYDSTLNGNQSNRAGAIQNNGTGKLNLRNVTISGNRADVDDPAGASGTGGIHQNGFAVLNNVTITGNTGTTDRAGGIMTIDGATTVLKNSIIAGNIIHGAIDGTSYATDCLGPLTGDSKYNLIGISYGCTIPSYLSTFLLDPPPASIGLHAVLTSNRGPTQTHRLLTGSLARDAAYQYPQPAADGCEPRDQRGVPRPQGAGTCDLGWNTPVPTSTSPASCSSMPRPTPTSASCATTTGCCSASCRRSCRSAPR